jgi:sulfite reductase (ferredoxin)
MRWKEQLADKMPRELAEEIDVYETQLELRKLGKIDEKLFAETRLRRGAYGQRYDNGQRHDGIKTQQLQFPAASLTKGPDTMWDAPGMQRIKIPFGGLNAEQMELLADVSEEYADGILHVTTRQDFQLHFVHIEDTPALMRRLGSVGITTREACGNAVRNVTACPLAGVCHTEAFDVTPYAKALSRFLLGHPDTQDFGRKFKPAFSGCEQEACGLVNMHDLGAIALVRDGKRGFRLYVGGGLGPVPYQAKVFAEFLPEEELLPIAQAISRVFARLGEKQNRARARIKFLVAKLGIDEFRRLVMEERKILPSDPRWTAYLPKAHEFQETPARAASSLNGAPHPEGFGEWVETNVYRQRQAGYAVATVTLPVGDITAWQMRQLADLARKYCGDNIRTTVEQNIVLRWISEADLPELYRELKDAGLGDFGAGTILDVVACPGTDTCKLGIASSRGLARELRTRLAEQYFTMDAAVKGLRIKMSGCFNSCGQHHLADIGFYGNSRTLGNRKVPHFQVLLGGKWRDNAGSYGLAIGSVPSKNVPAVVERITQRFVKERQGNEGFQDFITRIGKAESRKMLEDLMEVPAYEKNAAFYSDWGDPREFTMGDMGVGECAGEVVSRLDFDLQAAERLCFEAQLKLEAKDLAKADELAYQSMLQAAQGLVKELWYDVPNEPDVIAKEFRARLFEPKLFWDRFVGGKFAQDFFRRHENPPSRYDHDEVHRLIEESQLFIEAAHACADKLREQKTSAPTVLKQ